MVRKRKKQKKPFDIVERFLRPTEQREAHNELAQRGRSDIRWRVDSVGEVHLYSVRYARSLQA